MSVLICPVCREELNKAENTCRCKNGHSFDLAREGYVNLLLGSKSGDKKGDSKESARARHAFLAKGYYGFLKEYLCSRMQGTVLDICCGDGYYDDYDGELYGFDISKEMVRLASKSNRGGFYFAANLANIPVKSQSVDTAIHLFAPFNEKEFARILKADGVLYSVIPGENHLLELKSAVYDKPYKNDEKPPEVHLLELDDVSKISSVMQMNNSELKTLFSMTPYFYRTSAENKQRLDGIERLNVTAEFVILKYKKGKGNS